MASLCLTSARAARARTRSFPSGSPRSLQHQARFGAGAGARRRPDGATGNTLAHPRRAQNHRRRALSVAAASTVGEGEGEDGQQSRIGDTVSALDGLLGTKEAEAAAAAEAAEAEAAAAERRSRDQRGALRQAKQEARRLRDAEKVLTYRPMPPGLLDRAVPAEMVELEAALADSPRGGAAPNSFVLPLITRSQPVCPGEIATFNLYEPRWVTLFAALLARDGSGTRTLLNAAGQPAMDLDADERLRIYEMSEQEIEADNGPSLGKRLLIVPGHGRLPEQPFVASRRFGVVYREKGRVGRVGCEMEVLGTDMSQMAGPGSTPVLVVLARAVRRFRIDDVLQVKPYVVVNAEWVGESEAAGSGDAASREAVLGALEGALNSPVDESEMSTYYERSRLVELDDREAEQVLQAAAKLPARALAATLLRRRPRAKQRLLESDDAVARLQLIEGALAFKDSLQYQALDALSNLPALLFLGLILGRFFRDSNP